MRLVLPTIGSTNDNVAEVTERVVLRLQGVSARNSHRSPRLITPYVLPVASKHQGLVGVADKYKWCAIGPDGSFNWTVGGILTTALKSNTLRPEIGCFHHISPC